MSENLNQQIHEDIGHLKAQMDNCLSQLEKISSVVTTVAVHDDRIVDLRTNIKNHQDWIDGSKKHSYFWSGGTIGGAGLITTILNHFFPGHP